MENFEGSGGKANWDTANWEAFREKTLELSKARDNDKYFKYASSLTERAWQHILSENYFTPEAADKRLWGFFQSDEKIAAMDD